MLTRILSICAVACLVCGAPVFAENEVKAHDKEAYLAHDNQETNASFACESKEECDCGCDEETLACEGKGECDCGCDQDNHELLASCANGQCPAMMIEKLRQEKQAQRTLDDEQLA